jgi:adenylate cyclase class 2
MGHYVADPPAKVLPLATCRTRVRVKMVREGLFEVETKFYVPALAELRVRLLDSGATLSRRRVFEQNIRLDIDGGRLLHKGQMLRLRRDGRNVMTFKGPPPPGSQSEVKVREELEISFDDYDTAVAILRRLGYEPVQTYEKYRETFSLDDIEIVLDELPFGNFVELEGREATIKSTARRLELDWDRRLNMNYLALMDLLVQQYDLPCRDLTFGNFQDIPYTIGDIHDQILADQRPN